MLLLPSFVDARRELLLLLPSFVKARRLVLLLLPPSFAKATAAGAIASEPVERHLSLSLC